MSFSPNDNFYLNLVRGNLEYRERHVVGTNEAVGTTFVPISRGSIYQTPTTATSLEILSSSANDTAAGTGARTVSIYGLDGSWQEITQVVSMNGVTPVPIPTNMLRVFEVAVTTSGTYATQTAGSHAGTITLRVAGAGATWAIIYSAGFPRGSTQIGAYTIPLGKTGVIFPHYLAVESNKPANVVYFSRQAANIVTAPYGGMNAAEELGGLQNIVNVADFNTPRGPFVGPTDVGYIAAFNTGTGSISLSFEVIMYDTV